jgi:ComF family protein
MMERFLQWLFPDTCLGCTARGELLCQRCLQHAPRYGEAPPQTGAAQICIGFLYTGFVREALLLLKYCGQRRYAGVLARGVAPRLTNKYVAIVPLPAAASRVAKRGYDQAVLLAEEVAAYLQVPCWRGLIRTRETTAQAKLDRNQRIQNVAAAFAWNGTIPDGGVLLVDDICTTGATLSEAIDTLHRAGIVCVDVMVVARGNTKPSRSPEREGLH